MSTELFKKKFKYLPIFIFFKKKKQTVQTLAHNNSFMITKLQKDKHGVNRTIWDKSL